MAESNKFPHESDEIRKRLRGFSIKPWESDDSDWCPAFVNHCLLLRYTRKFKKCRIQGQFGSAGLDESF